ncbi:MAG: dipicolinate synthase subunit B [Defluviitaleaceae bacterium]|nr:dipicolinate synthase subunit B [Defluviitaleaceae bacterium]
MTLEGKKVGFGITSSFCTLNDILDVMRKLKDMGADIYPVVSDRVREDSSRFHNRDEFLAEIRGIAGRREFDSIAGAETFGPVNQVDIMVIAPATGNTIGKMANGIWDTPVLLAAKATLRNEKPLLLAIFTNDALSMNGENIMKLYNTKNIYFVPFGQDDPVRKPASMLANLALLGEAATHAIAGRQMQPAIIPR